MHRLISLMLAATTGLAVAAPGDFHYVKPEQAVIREAPAANAPTKYHVMIGRKLVELERQGEYVRVGIAVSGGRGGWVSEADLSPTDPDGLQYDHCVPN